MFLVLATFASVTKSYGQAVAGLAPRPLTITDDAMQPIAGRPYTYSAVINPVGGQAYWYATKATTFMTAGARVAAIELPVSATSILAGATNYMTLAAAGTSPTSTTITWTSDVLNGINATTSPLFVVVEYNGPAPCTTSNNIKVMQIVPRNAFTIDITNMTHATPTALAYGVAESQCYAALVSSSWDVATSKMVNDYGVNDLYFEVVAANFTGAYKPTLKLSGLQSTQTADINWDVAVGGTYANSAGSALGTAMPFTSATQNVTTTATDTHLGVAIYVRVRVKNNGYEGLTALGDDITLAVDATDNSATPNQDVMPDGTAKAAFAELAIQKLHARPTVTAGAGVTFIVQKP
ncbi:MAG: hypothetical protein NTY07_00560 [Bacteroidia bacterium]|nr:hypothetical protein [Bacteroidia bacterium]